MTNKYRNTSRKKTPWDTKESLSPLEAFIKTKYLDSFSYKHPKLIETNESELLNSYVLDCCRHCGSLHIKKKGFTANHIQRYVCLDCKKSFTVLTNTLFENHKIPISEWIEFCLGILRFESISIASKTNKNSFNTSKYWLHKLFIILNDIQDTVILKGNVEIDETFFSVQEPDKIKKEGKQLRGLSRNQFCIGVGYDGINIYAYLEGMGKTSQKKTLETFQNHIEEFSHLIHDKEKSHRILVKKLNLTDDVYDANEIKKLDNKENPLYLINQQCNLIKRFLHAHDGFARNDLQDYLNLYCFINNPPYKKLEKVEILLDRALHYTKSLKYRDFFSKKYYS